MSGTRFGFDVRLSAGAAATTIATMSSFHSVFRGWQWLYVCALVTAVAVAVCSGVRATGKSQVWTTGAAVVATLLLLTSLFASSTAWLKIVPTAATATKLFDLGGLAMRRFVEEQAPLQVHQPDLFIMATLTAVVAITTDWLCAGRRLPALAGIIFAAVFLLPTVAAGLRPDPVVFALIAAGWLYLLRTEVRSKTFRSERVPHRQWARVPAAAIAVAALAAGLAIPPILPAGTSLGISWGNGPPGAFEAGINPIVVLGENLRRQSDVKVLEYTTDGDRPVYLKAATLQDFTGTTWEPGPSVMSDRESERSEGGEAIQQQIARRDVTTGVDILALNARYLPVPYPVKSVTGLEGNWQWQPDGRTFETMSSNTRGQSYSATSAEVSPTKEQMRRSDARTIGTLVGYTSLPAAVPKSLIDEAHRVTDKMSNDYDKAIALQSYFTSGNFTYSETAPVAEGFDGNGLEVLDRFLQEKQGYCVHFSSAMAVMARVLGMPARIAVGYAPGIPTERKKNGKQVYEVASNLLHAWPEIHFDGVGWVSFEPTPGRGVETNFRSEFAAPGLAPQSAAAEDRRSDRQIRSDAITDQAGAGRQKSASAAPIGLGAGVLILVLALPALVRVNRRRLRLRPVASVEDQWRELIDTARDYGIRAYRADTPGSFGRRLATAAGPQSAALDRLIAAVEEQRYARTAREPDDLLSDDVRRIRACLISGSSRWRRIRAVVLPALVR